MRDAAALANRGDVSVYALDPRGVAGRNSDNTFIKQVLNWEPRTHFKDGLTQTYKWIESQYMARKAGQRVVDETS